MKRLFVRRWFLLGLIAVLAAGTMQPARLEAAAEAVPRNWIVAVVLFLMALPLGVSAMWNVARRPAAPAIATFVNSCLLPPLAWLLSPLLEDKLSVGLIVTATVPCTLASAAVWTRRAGGNESIALFVTVFTNFFCFIVTPLWLLWLTATEVSINSAELIGKLALLVVLPMVVAQLLRVSPKVCQWSQQTKPILGVLAQLGILSIVFVGAVQCGLRLSDTSQPPVAASQWLLLISVVLVLHLAALYLGFYAARAGRLPFADCCAVGIAGSQKTMMVGLQIAIEAFGGGLAILPLVAYHVTQLFVDTIIADRWRTAAERQTTKHTKHTKEANT